MARVGKEGGLGKSSCDRDYPVFYPDSFRLIEKPHQHFSGPPGFAPFQMLARRHMVVSALPASCPEPEKPRRILHVNIIWRTADSEDFRNS